MMFYTVPEFRAPTPPFPGLEHYTCWHVIQIFTPLPWFLIRLRKAADADLTSSVMYQISSSEQLRYLLQTLPERDAVTGLQMLLPGLFAKSSESWVMKTVSKMWNAQVHLEGNSWQITLFEMSDGDLVLDPPVDTAPQDAIKGELLFDQDRFADPAAPIPAPATHPLPEQWLKEKDKS